MSAVDLDAGHGLDDGEDAIESNCRAALAFQRPFRLGVPLLPRDKIEVFAGLDTPSMGMRSVTFEPCAKSRIQGFLLEQRRRKPIFIRQDAVAFGDDGLI